MRGTLVLDTVFGAWVPADRLDADAMLHWRSAGPRWREKMSVVLGGYVTRADELGRRLGTAAAAAIREMAVEYESFARLRAATESTMGPARVAMLKEDKLEALEIVAELVWGVGEGEEGIREQGLGVGRAGHGGGRKAERGDSFYGRLKYGVVDRPLSSTTVPYEFVYSSFLVPHCKYDHIKAVMVVNTVATEP